MAKRYKVKMNGQEYDVYLGQIWMAEGNGDYRKITGISKKMGDRLGISLKGRGDEKPKTMDMDDLMLWIMDNNAQPLVVSYVEYEEIET